MESKKIDKAMVRNIAKLSRLDLSDDQLESFSHQLAEILDYIEKLNHLDTAGVEPLAHCLPVSNVFREDTPGVSLPAEQALANAPARVDDFFKVPKILDDASSA